MPRAEESPPRSPRRLRVPEARALWWSVLDTLEENPRLRRGLLAGVLCVGAAGLAVALVLPKWRERNLARITREWIAMGRLDLAGEELRRAINSRPELPLVWTLSADLARTAKDLAGAATYSARAAKLAPTDLALARTAAADALLADQPEEARALLAGPAPDAIAADAEAQRLLGDLARRDGNLPAALARHEDALRLAGPNPRDEISVGRLLLLGAEPARREEGAARLLALAGDPEHGATALRALLADALTRGLPEDRLRLARRLRDHPRCSIEDVPVFLRTVAALDPGALEAEIGRLAANHRADSVLALRFIDWMNQVGLPRDALRHADALPLEFFRSPALQVGRAEALRLAGEWATLATRAAEGDWGREYEFLRLAYALEAARRMGDEPRREELRASLRSRVATQGVHAVYAAGALYLWGQREDALALAELAAQDPQATVPALGLILRHHQLARDAVAQHDVFRRLHALRPEDPAIRNNYAYFALITGRGVRQALDLARANHAAAPDQTTARATLALALVRNDQAAAALELLGAPATWTDRKRNYALPGGLALAALRRTGEARVALSAALAEATSDAEAALIRETLERLEATPDAGAEIPRPPKP